MGAVLSSQSLRKKVIDGSFLTAATTLALHEHDDPAKKIAKGRFVDEALENRIAEVTFEPQIEDVGFIIDKEATAIFRPHMGRNGQYQDVYRTLLEFLPKRRRQEIKIHNGAELDVGFVYLFPNHDRIKLELDEYGTSSGKSSWGRIFLLDRLMADGNPTFDEFHPHPDGKHMRLWSLLIPLRFKPVVYAGQTLNQFSIIKGNNAKLTQEELLQRHMERPLLYDKTPDGELVPTPPIVTADGIRIALDCKGAKTHGVFGLRARRNPRAIDTKAKKGAQAEDYFEPQHASKNNGAVPDECYILATKEVVDCPIDLAMEMRTHSHTSLQGAWDYAKKIGPGFKGDLVLEAMPRENAAGEFTHGMPVSSIEAFRVDQTPDKPYAGKFSGQFGPKLPGFFTDFDYETAARDNVKLSRDVLVQDAIVLRSHSRTTDPVEFLDEEQIAAILTECRDGFFHMRYDAEEDERLLQPIPYELLITPQRKVFGYWRAQNKKDYGDARLFGKFSIGVGGHINVEDKEEADERNLDCIEIARLREKREEVRVSKMHGPSVPLARIDAYDKDVDRVHFGIVYATPVGGRPQPNETSIAGGKLFSIDALMRWHTRGTLDEHVGGGGAETWTRVLIPHLNTIYNRLYSAPASHD